MIIDLILDRKDFETDGNKTFYSPDKFYRDCFRYGQIGHDITRAMDFGTELDVKHALCDYIHNNEYNPDICGYIYSVNWL